MRPVRILLACTFVLAVAAPSFAQVGDTQCILAGRLTAEQRWAPRLSGIELLGQDGKVVSASSKQALAGVRQVRLKQPALLSRCDGDQELTRADDQPAQPKTPVPAASAGPGLLSVQAVSFPKLRTGGELVELKLDVPTERVVMLTR